MIHVGKEYYTYVGLTESCLIEAKNSTVEKQVVLMSELTFLFCFFPVRHMVDRQLCQEGIF